MKNIFKMIGVDGFLHFTMCFLMVILFGTTIGLLNSILLTTSIALLKEIWDVFIQKDNTYKEAIKDITMDILGIAFGLMIIII
jgi:hypothetical protein